MERSEPSLVPEWLKSSASGTTTHPLSSSLLHSVDHTAFKRARNKSSVNHNDNGSRRISVSDRTTPSDFRRSSSGNGSAHLREYSSFGRNSRSRDWHKELYEHLDRDNLVVGDHKHRDYSDLPGNIFPGNVEKDGLRRSLSMFSGRQGEAWPKISMADPNAAIRSQNFDGNGLLDNGSSGMHKAASGRNFPSLGLEERQADSEIGRVPSPGLSTASRGFPISVSAMTGGGDKWTSALAEVPAIDGNSGNGLSSGQQTSPSNSASAAFSTSTGLNMAETVAQGPPRAQTAPKISTGPQRLEELEIRQSRQLIPMTPSMPKPLVLNSSDKAKSKAGQQQHLISSPLMNPSLRGGPVKTDASKTTNTGKLLVLKSARERNGMSPVVKDTLSPTSSSKALTSAHAVATPVVGSTTSRGSAKNPVSPRSEHKHGLAVLEKRPTSQAQSRNEFFNLVRKQSMPNSSSVSEAGLAVSALTLNDPGELKVAPAPVTSEGGDVRLVDSLNGCLPTENKNGLICNDDTLHRERYVKNGKNRSTSLPLFSEEEEAAFLHKLGWQENADEGALTEDEISAFFSNLSKYMNSKPSLKNLQGVQPKFPLLFSSQFGAVSSGLISSDSKLES